MIRADMTKRILLVFFVLAALILPASAATKSHRQAKHSVSRSRKSKSKSMRKSAHRRKKLAKR
jgi:hypothetical protein